MKKLFFAKITTRNALKLDDRPKFKNWPLIVLYVNMLSLISVVMVIVLNDVRVIHNYVLI